MERGLVESLPTPHVVQDWLDAMPYNWESRGPTARTLRGVLRDAQAHCLEAALCAAAILEAHGYPPLVLDIESVDRLDHVIFVFQQDGRWGSVARSRCPGLHGRKPVFPSLDALVNSYMAPFIDRTGRVKGYGVLDLRRMRGVPWRRSERNVWRIEEELNAHRHRRLPTPEPFYREWKAKFDAWSRTQGSPEHAWPPAPFYPGASDWMGGTTREARARSKN